MKAFDVAQYILIEESKKDRLVSNLRLQKYLYFSQFMSVGMYGIGLFTDTIEAWEYGPCVPSVYSRFKMYGSTGIIVLGWDNNKYVPDVLGNKFQYEEPEKYDKIVIDKAIEFCDKFTNKELTDICHSHDCWGLAYHGAYLKCRMCDNGCVIYSIPEQAIYDYIQQFDESVLLFYGIKEREKPKTTKKKRTKGKKKINSGTNLLDKLRKV